MRAIFTALLMHCLIFTVKAQNTAVHFDGVNDYISTTFPGFNGNAPRTIEAWIKTTANSDPNNGGVQSVITDMGSFITGARFTFNVLWNDAIRIEVGGSGLGGVTPVNDGVWHHVAVTYNPLSANNFKLYVDGVLDAQGNIPTAVNTSLVTPLQIGRRLDDTRYFEGAIDEVRVYNVERTAQEIASDYNTQVCTPSAGLVAYYTFNNGSGGTNNTGVTTSLDYSGNNYTATFHNFAMTGIASNFVLGPPITNSNATSNSISLIDCYSILAPSGTFTITQSGTYTDVLTNAAGCDSILTINATIGRTFNSFAVHSCGSYTAPSGAIFTTPGTKKDTLFGANAAGCDSILTIQLTIGPSLGTFAPTACDSFVLPSGAITYQTGLNIDTLPNGSSTGCDSIIYVYLTLNSQSLDSIAVTTCDTFYSPQGQVITQSQQFTELFTSSTGCDSTVWYDVAIVNSYSTSEQITACDSALVNNTWYYASELIELNLSSSQGCDSNAVVDLTIESTTATASYVNNELVASGSSGSYQWINCTTFQPISGATSQTYKPIENGNYAVVILGANCSDTSTCVEVVNVGVVAATASNLNSIIYPNPASSTISITGDEVKQLEITSIGGQLIATYSVQPNQEIAIDLPSGFYFARLIGFEGNVQTQVIQVIK